jgi:hypothetical protein
MPKNKSKTMTRRKYIQDLIHERLCVSVKYSPLTDDEKKRLRELRGILEKVNVSPRIVNWGLWKVHVYRYPRSWIATIGRRQIGGTNLKELLTYPKK